VETAAQVQAPTVRAEVLTSRAAMQKHLPEQTALLSLV
jgi:hypothetical protein